jgi:hypothetical protein
MSIVSFTLDPNAAAYTDDEIVAKINSASSTITRTDAVASSAQDWSGKDADDLSSGSSNLFYPSADASKLAGIEEGATADQSGDEIITAINGGSSSITREDALSQDDLNIVKSNPGSGEFYVKNIQRDSTGKLDVEYDNVSV